MATDELCFMTATALAKKIRSKQLSAKEVMTAHLEQIDRVNPAVNAIVTYLPEQAMEGAAAADEMLARGKTGGPLHGLPVAHKDLVETRGIRTTYGSPIYKDNVPEQDALIVDAVGQRHDDGPVAEFVADLSRHGGQAVILHRQHHDIDVSDLARTIDHGDADSSACLVRVIERVGGDAALAQCRLARPMAHDKDRRVAVHLFAQRFP